VENGLYVKKYVSSFSGYAPAKEPRILVGVMIDEPQKGQHFGAVAAAPVFSEVVGSTLRLLSVNPDKPLDAPGLQTVDNATTKPGATAKKLQAKNSGKTATTAKKEDSRKQAKNRALASNKTASAQRAKNDGEKNAVKKDRQRQRRETAAREQSSKQDGGNG